MTKPVTIVRGLGDRREAWERLYAAYAEFYAVEQTAAMRARVHGWIEDGALTCFLALDAEGRALGFAHAREFLRPLSATRGGYLDDLFDDPAARGSGVAEALFSALGEEARARGWSVVRWITRETNYRARALYDRLAQRTPWITYDLAP